ncbi:MAG: monooxygenase [Deltaproteobacteria bacterium]|nr:monooxygenase [Deltaproteobacteria bacterium]
MSTPKISDLFDIDFPLFAFSHCRDVVVEVSKAGGMGVFGAVHFTPEQLEVELAWIEDHIDGHPYGIDLVMPTKFVREEGGEEFTPDKLWDLIPDEYPRFAKDLCDRYGVSELPDEAEVRDTAELAWSERVAREQLEIALRFSPALLVNALGVPPADVVERVHGKGVKIGALVGRVRHAIKQKEAGVDIIIANGHEAAGHTGDITTMVLVPQVAQAVAPTPVLAAGGIGTGRQMAAAMVLGAQGAWCGSLWLTSAESELLPEVREKLIEAGSEQTARTRCVTGKPARHLITPYTRAWDDPETLDPLPMPLQTMATTRALTRISRKVHREAGAQELATTPAGQVIGLIDEICSCSQIVREMKEDYVEALERIDQLIG